MKVICPTLQTLQIKLQTRIFFEWSREILINSAGHECCKL